MRALQKIVRHGNASYVCIPRPMLIGLGWLPGIDIVCVDVQEDGSVRLRKLQEDYSPIVSKNTMRDQPETVKR